MRGNPLLQRPPKHHHRLSQENRLVKRGWPEPHVGVFTAVDPAIAVGYAFSALEKESPHSKFVSDPFELQRPGYMCVVTLDVTNLRVEPDVDALLWWYERGGDIQVRETLEDGHYEPGWDDEQPIYKTVDSYLLNDLQRFNFSVLEDKKNQLLAREALAGVNRALGELLIVGFPQHRYLMDFGLDRVLEVRTFRPFWNAVFDSNDDEQIKDIEAIEARGIVVVTDEELLHDANFLIWKTLYKKSRKAREVAYHGMTSFALEKAFPELFRGKKKLPPADTTQTEAAR